MKTARLKIDLAHTKKLFRGEPIVIKVPEGATLLEINLSAPKPKVESGDSIAKILDVFFNGRKA